MMVSSTPESDYTGSASQVAASSVTANGVLMPARQVTLSFGVGGSVEWVGMVIGENVQAGQTVATLDTVELQRAVVQVDLELVTAQARLAQLQAQAMPVPERVLAPTRTSSTRRR
jgi:macrolide-specific efflux system membrane fusion protein